MKKLNDYVVPTPMDERLVDSEIADNEPPRRAGPWKLIVVVAVLTLIGVWLVPGDDPQDTPETARTPAGTERPPSLLEEQPPAAPEATVQVDDRPGAMARALIAELRQQGQPDLGRAVDAAARAQAEGALADAYLLYFFAAREGHAGAALELGTQADPAHRDAANSVLEEADLAQAHKWYQMAAKNGSAEGQQRLTELRSRVEELAAAGDPQAQRISLQWQ